MQILYIWDADYPWDIRVEKICKTLARNGYGVHIAARNLKKRPENEVIDGLQIHRLKSIQNGTLNYALSFPVFFSPVWRKFLDRIIAKNNIKLLIVRDLPMAIAAIWAGERHGIPVVLDMAEDYLAMIWDIWRAKKFHGFNLVVRNPYLVKFVEKYVFNKADHIWVVIEEAIKVVVRGGGIPEQVTVVSNTPDLSVFSNTETETNDDFRFIRKRFSAIYTGGIQMGRGIQTVLGALPQIITKIPDFLFVIVGDGYATEALKRIVVERSLQNHVLWVGWVDHYKIFDYIRMSKVGLIPHFVTDHVNTTIPNKIFDYMGCGVAVVSSDAVPMKRILEEEKCGLTFRSGDSNDLAKCIINIHEDGMLYGRNGVEAVKQKYHWKEDERRLLAAVKSLC
ncbi:MAG: glycosyltransferase family 4 protein [Nitrospirae bacterium]|nr:glycosyltransferase family 4 protein [Candidatus Manganitrophaceae bacterium]